MASVTILTQVPATTEGLSGVNRYPTAQPPYPPTAESLWTVSAFREYLDLVLTGTSAAAVLAFLHNCRRARLRKVGAMKQRTEFTITVVRDTRSGQIYVRLQDRDGTWIERSVERWTSVGKSEQAVLWGQFMVDLDGQNSLF
jgi:hypothetical protein